MRRLQITREDRPLIIFSFCLFVCVIAACYRCMQNQENESNVDLQEKRKNLKIEEEIKLQVLSNECGKLFGRCFCTLSKIKTSSECLNKYNSKKRDFKKKVWGNMKKLHSYCCIIISDKTEKEIKLSSDNCYKTNKKCLCGAVYGKRTAKKDSFSKNIKGTEKSRSEKTIQVVFCPKGWRYYNKYCCIKRINR